ncbi:Asp-tRNA(Asn)/Glu-tRNA(Gln) amidotransferase subunit GatA [Castellaniella caeni]
MLHQQSFSKLRQLYQGGAISPVEVALSALEHAEAINPRLNAFALLDRKRALAHARLSEQRWHRGAPASPIDGMPMTVKEFAMVAGWPCPRGSAITSRTPDQESTVFVQRLDAAGAVLLGKTRAPEFNWKGVTDSPAFGVTRNPWNPGVTTGGSSGGCAAAVGAGVVRASVGSDAGGSVRIPAAFTGTIGLKPTYGRIPLTPNPSHFFHIAHVGPIAIGMDELMDVYRVVAGPSVADWTSFGGQSVSVELPPARRLRVGVLNPERWWPRCEAAVNTAMEQVMSCLQADGFQLVTVDYDVEAATRVGAELYRLGCAATVRDIGPGLRPQLDPGLLKFVQSVQHCGIAHYQQLCRLRDQQSNRLAACFSDVDVLILPTLPLQAFAAGNNVPPGSIDEDWMSWNPFTPAFNSTQVPALSYPVWPSGSALPAGIQLVAGRYQEPSLFSLAHWLQRGFPPRVAPCRP